MSNKHGVNTRLNYELHFQSFLMKLINISNLYPREKYLYPLMDTVIFKDFETAINSKIIDFADIANDNGEFI